MGMVLRRYRWSMILAVPAGFVIGVVWGMMLTGGDLVAWGEFVLSLGWFSAFIAALAAFGLFLGVHLGDRELRRRIGSRVLLGAAGAAGVVFTTLLLIGLVTQIVANPGYANPLAFVVLWAIPISLASGVVAALAVLATDAGYRKLRILA
ncbi:hypothetical protein [Mycetocola lacteus]|nr:hypothetical protein [Mycetocola lacteus]